MNTHTEIISQYLNKELSATDRALFEAQLQSDAELKKEFDIQVQLIEAVKRHGIQQEIKKSIKKIKTQKLFKQVVIGLAISLAALGVFYVAKKYQAKSKNNILHELNETGTNTWTEADKVLEAQVFSINTDRDTIIETEHGIVIAIPANAFVTKQGTLAKNPVELEIKEAMTAADIMKAQLSTTSNGKLLETGGMFYINARNGEENLVIDKTKAVNVNVPNNSNKSDMQLFRGERLDDGSINWIDPKPLQRKLTTVDITTLNFYPEHFLDSVKAFGFDSKNKKVTDSIYYSFSTDCNAAFIPSKTDTLKVKDSVAILKSTTLLNGETIFKMNCAMCHSLNNNKVTGPGLKDILNRVPSMSWLKQYIINNNALIKNGDKYALKLIADNGGVDAMPEYPYLSSKEIDVLIEYITGKKQIIIDEAIPNILDERYVNCPEINPSKIKAIWDKQFNNTILATKEFEERLKVIFRTCDARILNLYVKNLNHNLYELDSVAATLTNGEVKERFMQFYNRKDGGVEVSNVLQKKLQQYFEVKQRIYSQAVSKALQALAKTEANLLQHANDERAKHQNNEAIRQSKVFSEELEINTEEAYRQLGKKRPTAQPANNYLSADISQMGWNNVDRYVIESTIARTTLDYTDPETNKKAVIKYQPISVTVNQLTNYDKVVCYMIPDKLNSFQLLKQTSNCFNEKLNELMTYRVIAIGYKGNSTYYHQINGAKPQAYTVDLKAIDKTELEKQLNNSCTLNQQQDLSREINYQLFEQQETKRLLKIRQREEITHRLEYVVFPCYGKKNLSYDYVSKLEARARFMADSISNLSSDY